MRHPPSTGLCRRRRGIDAVKSSVEGCGRCGQRPPPVLEFTLLLARCPSGSRGLGYRPTGPGRPSPPRCLPWRPGAPRAPWSTAAGLKRSRGPLREVLRVAKSTRALTLPWRAPTAWMSGSPSESQCRSRPSSSASAGRPSDACGPGLLGPHENPRPVVANDLPQRVHVAPVSGGDVGKNCTEPIDRRHTVPASHLASRVGLEPPHRLEEHTHPSLDPISLIARVVAVAKRLQQTLAAVDHHSEQRGRAHESPTAVSRVEASDHRLRLVAGVVPQPPVQPVAVPPQRVQQLGWGLVEPTVESVVEAICRQRIPLEALVDPTERDPDSRAASCSTGGSDRKKAQH